ncbi:hypothetical protein I4U23_004744 [Adineta vaga]|nr:hypothetical protein I4U23_004744 [Adineta vaga]
MNFESLPNEILLELFDYFNSILNDLIYKQYPLHWFKFSSIKKSQFDEICQQHLPYLIIRIYDRSFFEKDTIPGLTDLFFAYIQHFELPHLLNLTHLTITCFRLQKRIIDYQLILVL